MSSPTLSFTAAELASAVIFNPLVAKLGTTVMAAIAQMDEERSRQPPSRGFPTAPSANGYHDTRSSCIIIVNETTIVGLLTERDIIRLCAQGQPLDQLTVDTVMTTPVTTLRQTEFTDGMAVLGLLQQQHMRHLPLVDEQDQLVGLITYERLLEIFIDTLPMQTIRAEQQQLNPPLPTWSPDRSSQTIDRTVQNREVLVAQIANWIRVSLTLQNILDACVVKVRSFLECDRVVVYQFQPDGDGVVVAEAITPGWLSAIDNPVTDTCFHRQAPTLYSGRTPIVVNNIYATSYTTCHITLLEHYQIKSSITAPIYVAGQLWGLLISHQCSDYRQWHPEDIGLMQDVVMPLAIAIQQSLTHEQLQAELKARQQAEANLLQSEQRYANLAQSTPVGIFQTNIDGRTVYINEYCSELIQLSSDEAMGDGWLSKIHPEDREQVLREWSEAVHAERPFQLEYRFLHTDGQVVWVYGQCVAERDRVGQLMGYVGTLTDITKRKQAELDLQRSESENRAFLAAIPDLMLRMGADGRCRGFISWNRELAIVQDENEILHKLLTDVMPPVQAQQQLYYLQRALETGQLQVFEQQIPVGDRLRDEEVRIIKCGEDEALFIIRDISDRHRLEQTTKFLASIVESSGDAIITKTLDGLITSWNEAAEQLFGYTEAEAVGQPIAILFPPEQQDEEQTIMERIKRGDRVNMLETVRLHKDGTRIDVAITVSALWNRDGQLVGTSKIARNITQRKQAEAQLRETTQRLAIATESAQIGVWDWDLGQNRLTWDQRMYTLYAMEPEIEPEKITRLEHWQQRVHPDDVTTATAAFQEAIAKRKAFHSEFRILWPDDQVRHISAHALVIHDDQGNPQRMIGVNWDITEQKLATAQMEALVTSTASCTGEDFLAALVRHIANTLDVPFVSVAEQIGEKMNTLAFWANDALQPNLTYSWVNTPCAKTLQDGHFLCQDTLQQEFPLDPDLVTMQVNSYLGVVLENSTGQIFGLLCILSPNPIRNPHRAEQILRIFAARTVAELERQRATAALEQLNQSLEIEVEERTAALRERETRYGALMAGASDGILLCDRHGNILEVNNKVLELLGYSYAELTTMHITKLHSEADWPQISQAFEEVLQQERSHILDVNFLHCNGSRLPIDISASVLTIQGQFIVQAILRDIRERKQLEAERERAEQVIHQQAQQEQLLAEITLRIRQSLNLQTIFDTACREIRPVLQAERVGIFQFDLDSNYESGKFVAESVVEGFIAVVGMNAHDHCFGQDYAQFYAKGRYLVADDICHNQFSSCHSDMLLKFEVRACIVMPLICGQLLWGLLCIHQCTAPHQWESSEITLSQRFANQLAIAIQQAKLYEQVQQELAERQQAQQLLTERNQQLALSNQELARATRLKDEFLANMSHELRTPLNAILGLTEGLQDQVFGPISNEQLKTLKTIERSGSHLLELINDILDVAKIESGQMEFDCISTSIIPICQSSLIFVKQQALKKRIQIETHLPPRLPHICVDERRIRQVLINLLNNAVKFTPEGGHISLSVSQEQPQPCCATGTTVHKTADPLTLEPNSVVRQDGTDPDVLFISVTDTGIGIAPEQMDKLFQPFVQIDSALNRQYSGTGLGLALVKRIVELHRGSVFVTSETGRGSRFTITLPCKQPQSCDCSQPQDPPFGDQTRHLAENEVRIESRILSDQVNSPLILLAEDNKANVSTISSYLRARGYHILLAGNGYEAIELARSHIPDLILMDIQMPKLDGIEAMQRIRSIAELRNVPIMALTALAMESDRDRCLAAGANDYISKPVKLKQLVSSIERLLGQQSG